MSPFVQEAAMCLGVHHGMNVDLPAIVLATPRVMSVAMPAM